MPHVQTVLGPIDPAELGVTLPHEHTQIALWHIENRWDYWQLTRDEPLILEEQERFRAAGAESLLPRLREAGVGAADIETMTVANPRRLLTIDGEITPRGSPRR